MKIAVFSDVHGNWTAVEAILADIATQSVDGMVFAGDLCFLGPRPAECLKRVRELGIPCVYGNTDEWILGRQAPPESREATTIWTSAQLDEGARAWLGSLPFAHRVSPTDNPADDLLVVHANPLDVNGVLFPPEAEQVARFGQVQQTDEALGAYLNEADVPQAVAFGHLHLPSIRLWQGKQLFNISSVSLPMDGDARAKYGLVSWANGRWALEHRRVAYDIAAEVAAYTQSGFPGWQGAAEALQPKSA